jgi:hypothetical protein
MKEKSLNNGFEFTREYVFECNFVMRNRAQDQLLLCTWAMVRMIEHLARNDTKTSAFSCIPVLKNLKMI